MNYLIKAWIKYFIIVGLFGLCMHLITLVLPLYVMVVYDRVLFSASQATLYSLALGVLISLLVMALLDYLRQRMLIQAGQGLAREIMPPALQALSGTETTGYSRGLADLETLRRAVVQGHLLTVLDTPWIVGYLIVLYLLHPLPGLVAAGAVLLVVLLRLVLGRLLRTRMAAADTAGSANADFAMASLGQTDPVQGLGLGPRLTGIILHRQQQVLATQAGADTLLALVGTLMRFLILALVAAVFTAGVRAFFMEQITTGVLVASTLIAMFLGQYLARSLADLPQAIGARVAWRRIRQYLKPQVEPARLSLPEPQGHLQVENLTLALQGRLILQNISLDLAPGTSLGIIGPSSAGKTSLCRALLGLWPLAAGKVRLDGAELNQWPPAERGRFIGYLPQITTLFSVSVAENISRLAPSDTDDRATAVIEAARKTGIHDPILQLPQGYDTLVEGTGRNLSASQAQRIALARALYGNPRLVILDRPHTHLDDSGLKQLTQTLQQLKAEGVTILVVTDRPSLLGNMDQLLVLKEGRMSLYGPTREVYQQLGQGAAVGQLK